MHLLLNLSEAKLAAQFMAAVYKFLNTNQPSHLQPFVGRGVTDINGTRYTFETDPERLYELDAEAGTPFDIHYEIIAI